MKHLLFKSIRRNSAEALLLSGGLDSSILASILNPRYSLTTGLGIEAPNLIFARIVAKRYSSTHLEIILTNEKLLEILEQVIQISRSFDPIEIRNSSVVFTGIKRAKEEGYSKIMVGDGADELFAGYNYLKRYYTDILTLSAQLSRLWKIMHFSSIEIGKKIGIDVKAPFLDKEFVKYAKAIKINEKIGQYAGQKWGKFILRKCFEPELGKEIVWRAKIPQEQGAGIINIQNFFINQIDNTTFLYERKRALNDGVKIRDKEHLYYYNIFKKHFLLPKEEKCTHLRCPDCNGCFKSDSKFCHICGAFPVTPI